ncbi:unnamed protein product [Rhizoctonia solani]|uniref:endo-1,4-beta-xylanase n=1 Tax=Rhizoctonia solani TaxID=456999 RepID=A0A8H3E2R6_9AGAM|nr:unnamed protein product [Rhizoctonia solani]
MPIFGCFTLSTFCGPTTPQIDKLVHVPNGLKPRHKTLTADEEFFVTFGWPAGLPFEVHQHQIEHVRTSAVELYDVALRELGGAMAWSSEIGFSIESIKLYIKKLARFAGDWARLNRMEAYLRENEIKGEIAEQHTRNDYNTDWTGSKSDAYYKLAKSLLAQRVPLHGIGFRKLDMFDFELAGIKLSLPESHLIVNKFPRTVQANFQRFANLGLEIAITELDIRMTLPATNELLKAQAENYAYMVKSCLAISKCVGVTIWDASDDVSVLVNYTLPRLILSCHKHSWIPSVNPGQGAALLFNGNKQPKPAYYSVADTLAAASVSSSWS